MFSRRHSPTSECLSGFSRARWRVSIVERISVIENEQRLHAVLLKRGQQTIVGAEVISSSFFFRSVPFEIHPDPPKPGIRDHFNFARLRIGEVNINSETLRRV